MSMFDKVMLGVVAVLFIAGVAGLAVRLTRRQRTGTSLTFTPVLPASAMVWVTMYDHKHGTDIEVFESEAAAEAYRQELVGDYWDDTMEEAKPSDPKEAADAYFAAGAKHGEFFDVREQRVRH